MADVAGLRVTRIASVGQAQSAWLVILIDPTRLLPDCLLQSCLDQLPTAGNTQTGSLQ